MKSKLNQLLRSNWTKQNVSFGNWMILFWFGFENQEKKSVRPIAQRWFSRHRYLIAKSQILFEKLPNVFCFKKQRKWEKQNKIMTKYSLNCFVFVGFFINASIFITMLTIIFQIYCAFTFLWRQISISKLTTSCRRLRFRLICCFFFLLLLSK